MSTSVWCLNLSKARFSRAAPIQKSVLAGSDGDPATQLSRTCVQTSLLPLGLVGDVVGRLLPLDLGPVRCIPFGSSFGLLLLACLRSGASRLALAACLLACARSGRSRPYRPPGACFSLMYVALTIEALFPQQQPPSELGRAEARNGGRPSVSLFLAAENLSHQKAGAATIRPAGQHSRRPPADRRQCDRCLR